MSQAMQTDQSVFPSNVIPFRMAVILPRHREYLARWLEAGKRMGLCDAEFCIDDEATFADSEQALIWVRENASPAYVVHPEGTHWVVVDALRGNVLSHESSFEMALDFIRPALPLQGSVAAA
ncbi:hypothetical protein AA0242T_0006 [Acetobacter aceti NRIC 0242]|uniref:Uncharacterized protein n=1 Tax=Acetobacter aceti NBRC 14818 TaxID=887700 RepID=A0AB33IC33_ACEAC